MDLSALSKKTAMSKLLFSPYPPEVSLQFKTVLSPQVHVSTQETSPGLEHSGAPYAAPGFG